VLKTKDYLDDPIVLCMIVRLIVHSAYHYSAFAFSLFTPEKPGNHLGTFP
jgi:hypothetical protein